MRLDPKRIFHFIYIFRYFAFVFEFDLRKILSRDVESRYCTCKSFLFQSISQVQFICRAVAVPSLIFSFTLSITEFRPNDYHERACGVNSRDKCPAKTYMHVLYEHTDQVLRA